jgi:hypothetical protein
MNKLILAICALMLASCASVDSVKPDNTATTISVKGKNYDKVWSTAQNVMGNNQLSIVSADKANGVIKAENGWSFSSYGEIVGVFISPTTPNASQYVIQIKSVKKYSLNWFAKNWEPGIAQDMQQQLK